MTSGIKITALEDKSENRVWSIYKSYVKKHEQMSKFLKIANDFDIELVE